MCRSLGNYERDFENIWAKLQNFFGSRRDDFSSTYRGRKNLFERSNFNRAVVEFFLHNFSGGKIGNCGENEFCAGEKNNVGWNDSAIAYGFCCVGCSHSYFNRTFFSIGWLFRDILCNFARCFDVL